MNFENIYIAGDIHGDFSYINKVISNLITPDSLLIQVGDFGLGFHSEKHDNFILNVINNRLIKKNCQLFIIQGNHDLPKPFNEDIYNFSNIKLIKNYQYLTINDKKFLFVGGAISVDRFGRKEGIDYWPDEHVKHLNNKELKKLPQTDILILHSAPDICYPIGYDSPIVTGWIKYDKDLLNDLKKERQYLTKLLKQVRPKFLYYGHFHSSFGEVKQLEDFSFAYQLMDINEVKKIE